MSMMYKKVFESEFDAWERVHEMFPNTQWYLDHESSERAGYNTYRDINEFYNYICILNDRVEVNIKEGNKTINLWIKKEEPEIKIPTYDIGFNESELVIVKGALYRLSSNFNEVDIMKGNSNNLNSSITCLELINRINGVINEKNQHI